MTRRPAPTRQDRRSWTIQEYVHHEEPDSTRSELVRGHLVSEPRPGAAHGRTQLRLARRLASWVEDREIGRVMTGVGIVLSEDPPSVRGPDILFISRERLSGPTPEGFLETAPDLAVEITSPSNTASEIQKKVMDYLAAGVSMVWVVDPKSRTATSYRPDGEARMIGEEEVLEGAEVLPGLSIPLNEVLPE